MSRFTQHQVIGFSAEVLENQKRLITNTYHLTTYGGEA